MDLDEQRKRSVRCLQELYTVVVGVALAVAVSRIVRDSGFPIDGGAVPAFVAYVVTLVPFYTGTMRHFERSYVEDQGDDVRSGALLADFLLKFVEACGFLAVADLMQRPAAVAWGLVMLLSFNTVWGVAGHLGFRRRRDVGEGLRWALINLFTVPVLLLFLVLRAPSLGSTHLDAPLAVVVVVLAVVRTALDYALCWDVYFPGPKPRLADGVIDEPPPTEPALIA